MNPSWKVPQHSVVFSLAKATRYAIVIPVLNEGERITRQIQKMQVYAATADIWIVDGGSTDGALEASFLKSHGVHSLLRMSERGGLSSQLRIGIAHALQAGYDGVILIDGNDKDGVEAIPRFIQALEAGWDHVQGSRFVPGGRATNNPASRLAAIRYLHAPLIALAAGFHYTDSTNGFRAYSRAFLIDDRVQPFRNVFSYYELHYYLAIRAARLGFRVVEIPVERIYPQGKVPTKIRGLRGKVRVLGTLVKACLGKFDPPSQGETP